MKRNKKTQAGADNPTPRLSDADLPQIVRDCKLFADLSDTELLMLLPTFRPALRRYAKDGVIIGEGDTADRIFFVVEGQAMAQKLTSSGHVHILSIYEEGDFFGLDALFSSYKTSPLTYMAVGDCLILSVFADHLIGWTNSPDDRIIRNATHILADTSVKLLYKTDVLSKSSLRERILSYFSIQEQKNLGNPFTLRMTREQFAQYLCVNRSALSRELSRMLSEGLIELHEGRFVVKHDLPQ